MATYHDRPERTSEAAPAQPTGAGSRSGAAALPVGLWRVDPAHSSVGFTGRFLDVITVRGSFGAISGIALAARPPEDSIVLIDIDPATISTGVPRYDQQLRSPDFLHVNRYPTITFRSTSVAVEKTGWRITGDLTVRDVTRPVTARVAVDGVAHDPTCGLTRAGIRASFVVARERFGLIWNTFLPGGAQLLGSEVEFDLALCAVLHTG
jgi:polyisoprenoid-binding protein YceI